MGEFSHLSDKLIQPDEWRTCDNINHFGFKPNGIWLSRHNEWMECCFRMNWSPRKYRYRYRIKSIDMSQILVIPYDLNTVITFINKYRKCVDDNYYFLKMIDWERVANDYKGIYMPHIRDLNFYELCFTSLDVDSLVIFDPSIISFHPPEEIAFNLSS